MSEKTEKPSSKPTAQAPSTPTPPATPNPMAMNIIQNGLNEAEIKRRTQS